MKKSVQVLVLRVQYCLPDGAVVPVRCPIPEPDKSCVFLWDAQVQIFIQEHRYLVEKVVQRPVGKLKKVVAGALGERQWDCLIGNESVKLSARLCSKHGYCQKMSGGGVVEFDFVQPVSDSVELLVGRQLREKHRLCRHHKGVKTCLVSDRVVTLPTSTTNIQEEIIIKVEFDLLYDFRRKRLIRDAGVRPVLCLIVGVLKHPPDIAPVSVKKDSALVSEVASKGGFQVMEGFKQKGGVRQLAFPADDN